MPDIPDELIFAMYFSSICSIRFHPRNIVSSDVRCNDDVRFEMEFARRVALAMLEDHRGVFPRE